MRSTVPALLKSSEATQETTIAMLVLNNIQGQTSQNPTMSNQSSHLLLKNGTALIHDENDKVDAVRTDILISGSKISKIAANISPPPGSEVIDCTDNIISPGFVDTHHHVWQTLLKGRHANHTLLQYMPGGNFTSSLHTPEDTYWGQLAGCLEMMDCGTTSVVDFSHINYSPEHSECPRCS